MSTEKPLLENRFSLAETKRNQWFATVPEGVAADDVLEPGYWAHVARMLRPLDEITVVPDTCDWRSVLLVEDSWNSGARVQRIVHHELSVTTEAENAEGLRVQWRGPHARWCVVRKDGVCVKERLPSREVALTHMTSLISGRHE